MTAKQFRDELAKYDDDTDIVLLSEEGAKIRYFDVNGFALQKGTPRRDEDNNPQFEFDPNGASTKLFISITDDF